jgi:hypothetical protein
MTHSKKTEELDSIAKQANPDKRTIIVMKIKKHLQLTQSNRFKKAYCVLKQKFEEYFNHKLKIVSKIELNKSNE